MALINTLKNAVDKAVDKAVAATREATQSASEFGLDKTLKILKDTVINPYLADIGTVTGIAYADKKLHLLLKLKGMEDHEIEVVCNSIAIAEDGSQITFGEFTSNKPFAQNALNKFAASTYDIPDKVGVHLAMRCARTALGLAEPAATPDTPKESSPQPTDVTPDTHTPNEGVTPSVEATVESESARAPEKDTDGDVTEPQPEVAEPALDADLIFLQEMSNDDLDILVTYLTKDTDGKGRYTETLTKQENFKKYAPDHQKYVPEIIHELQGFGGNSLLNIWRGWRGTGGVPYKEILMNVADHLKVNYNKNAPVDVIEMHLLMEIVTDSLDKMQQEEIQQIVQDLGLQTTTYTSQAVVAALQTGIGITGMLGYNVALMVANAVAKAVLGKGLSLAANSVVSRALGIFAGPVGWLLTGLWTAIDAAGPAYRVTVPCVIQIAYLRKKYACQEENG